MADHVFDEYFCHVDPKDVKPGDLIYVNTFLLCVLKHNAFLQRDTNIALGNVTLMSMQVPIHRDISPSNLCAICSHHAQFGLLRARHYAGL